MLVMASFPLLKALEDQVMIDNATLWGMNINLTTLAARSGLSYGYVNNYYFSGGDRINKAKEIIEKSSVDKFEDFYVSFRFYTSYTVEEDLFKHILKKYYNECDINICQDSFGMLFETDMCEENKQNIIKKALFPQPYTSVYSNQFGVSGALEFFNCLNEENRGLLLRRACANVYYNLEKIKSLDLSKEEVMIVLNTVAGKMGLEDFLYFANKVGGSDSNSVKKVLAKNNILKAHFIKEEDYTKDRMSVIKHIVRTPSSASNLNFNINITKQDILDLAPMMRVRFLRYYYIGMSDYLCFGYAYGKHKELIERVKVERIPLDEMKEIMLAATIRNNNLVENFLTIYKRVLEKVEKNNRRLE